MRINILAKLTCFIQLLQQGLRLMVGVGDYAVYVKHMEEHHAESAILTHDEWFKTRMDARYGTDKNNPVKKCPC